MLMFLNASVISSNEKDSYFQIIFISFQYFVSINFLLLGSVPAYSMDFSSSLKSSQLGKLMLNSGILHSSWSKISELHESTTYPKQDSGLQFKIFQEAIYTLVVFVAPPIRRNSSVPTYLSGSQNQHPFHFLCTDKFSSFSFYTPAFELFSSAYNKVLRGLKLELLESKKPLIITGAALGGSVASLFTLSLLETIHPNRKRPLCITFGSPLILGASLQQIIVEDTVRNSCFLHVADAAQTRLQVDIFKPFGMFLICFDSECICIEEPEAVTELLVGVDTDPVKWRDYGEILQRLDQPSMADSKLMVADVISRMEKHAAKTKLRLDQLMKNDDIKISMAYLDRYREKSKIDKTGYYDQYKTRVVLPVAMDITKCKKELNDYWNAIVEEVENDEKKPLTEKLNLKARFVFDGNIYRQMIEPLDIADYYLNGQKEYRACGRSRHYVMLEKWFKDESIEPVRFERRDDSGLLSFDSCFWAELEEAMIVVNLLKTHEGMKDGKRDVLIIKLVLFEVHVWEMIRKREVSSEIFLEKSSFMRWWKEYKEIKGIDGFKSSPSHFTEFMNNGIYESHACKSIATDLNMRNPRDVWSSFEKYLHKFWPSLNILECSGEHVIDFLRVPHGLADVEALVGRLSAAWEAIGKKKKNPFRSTAVTRYLEDMTQKAECILVFLCNDFNDVDETIFIESLFTELHKREVTTFTYNLWGRENVDSNKLYRSSVGIMVLSQRFTHTQLDHLVVIMEYCKAKDLVLIPIYFKVTLSDISLWTYGHENVSPEYLSDLSDVGASRVQKWKAAIIEMASIDGHQWTQGNQFMLAEEVVVNACSKLYLNNSKNLDRILALLNQSQPSDAQIVGIWGMAGIGKTTVARELFEILAPQYDLSYFLQDFYLMGEMKGLRQMRDDFYSKVFGEEKLSIGACDVKESFMRDWFYNKTILLVLDDVSNARDAEAVVGGFDWFSHGHRIIITSRRKQVLVQCKVKEPYEIQRLRKFESFRLYRQYLNGESSVISELLSCSSGIPLALKVLGSSVSKQHLNNTIEHLHRLRRNPPTQIQDAFHRNFDGLDENEKNIFLDIACFFRGENKDHVVELLDACGFLAYLGIYDLIDESLISLLDNRIEMPIPFQDMGRFIVHEEDEDPCERSRLWDSNDIIDVLTNNSGTEAIEGIFLDASDLTCVLSPIVFDNMYRLRLLKFYCSSRNQCKLILAQGLHTLPDELRLLHWENYSLESLPQKFNPENLVEINMPYSNMEKLWEGKKDLKKLKKIKLSHSKKLTDILMLSGALNLEHIDLEGCISLVDVSTSIPRNGKLVSVNMKYCFHLRRLPTLVDLTSLKLLNLSNCSELDEIQDFAPNLKELYLAGTAIRELPLSIENLTELVTLDLEHCKRLHQLPFGISNSRSIIELKLSGCTSLENLPNSRSYRLWNI